MSFDKRLPPFWVEEAMAERLQKLVETTNRPMSFYLREALTMALPEIERIYLGEAQQIQSKKEGKE